MNQADILKLAETAGFAVEIESRFSVKIWALNQCRFEGTCHADVTDELTRFAELVAQHEAKVREELIARYDSLQSQYAELSVALDSAQHERERIAAKQQLNSGVNKNSSSIYEVDFGNDERSQGDKYAGCD